MRIIQDLLSDTLLWSYKTFDGNWNKGRNGNEVSIIVMHATVDNDINSSRSWFRNRKARASSHYIINTNGDVYQEVKEEDTAYHAGYSLWNGHKDINSISIGIELVNLNNGIDPYDKEQYQSAIELVKDIVQRRQIQRTNIVTHAQIATDKTHTVYGRKTDPKGFPMEQFLNDVFNTPETDPWNEWGTAFPLSEEQRGWGIPQLWYKNRSLGEAKSFETYIDRDVSITLFEKGAILYYKPTKLTYMVRY